MDELLQQYLITALWSSTGENGRPLDDEYGIHDASQELKEKSINELEAFKEKAHDYISEYKISDSDIAHDFWLTRNGHGAGFWDREYYPEDDYGNKIITPITRAKSNEIGQILTDIAKSFGEVSLYVGDDEKIYH